MPRTKPTRNGDISNMIIRLFIVIMIITPKKVLIILPRPPLSAAPPTTTAVMASNSYIYPEVDGETAAMREKLSKDASPAQKPVKP